MKSVYWGAAAAALMVSGYALAHDGKHPATAKQVAAALADPARADQAADDARRHAAEVVAFMGAGPGSTVVDFFPGRGYWTRILTGVVGPTGHVYALWPKLGEKYAAKPLPELQARKLGNVTAEVLATDAITTPKPVDIILTVQNYHDEPNGGRGEAAIDALNSSVFAALKKGGVYIVIDHADAAGTGMAGTSTTHRIDPAVVKAQVLKAGFVFAGESTVLANPDDDHSKNVFDPSIRGKTDQFIYKFRKP
ncbi:MAG: methyltransferase [Sphingomonas sp.]|nr:methyltransferase [Sphingomonas sp.]